MATTRRKSPVGTDNGHLTTDDLEFLARPLFGFLSTAAGPAPPQPRPVWFEATADGTIHLFTAPEALKVRRLQRDPRASILIASPVGERERWVSAAGGTTIESHGTHELVRRLFARYRGAAAAEQADELAGMLTTDWVRIVIHPDAVKRFAN